MRCPYCQQNIRVQGRFCPKCGEQIFGLPVRSSGGAPATPTTGGAAPPATPVPVPRPAAPPPYRPFGGPPTPPDLADDGIVIETDEPPAAQPSPSASTVSGLHPAAGDEVGKTCPYCRFPLKPGEQVMTCPACKVPHHGDCWSENRGCTTYGCQGTAAAAAPATPSVAPAYQPRGGYTSPHTVGIPDLDSLQQTELSGRANNALILSALGLCCFPLGLIGLFMAISILGDLARLNMRTSPARGKAIAAIVLTVISIVIGIIALAMSTSGRGGSY